MSVRGTSNGSRRYRRVANSPQVDDSLFGAPAKTRTRQAGREIVNGGLVENSSTTSKSVLNKSRGKNASPTKLQVIDAGEIERIQRETRIITAVELEEIQANNDAEQERQRLSMKARKEYMMKKAEEAAKRAPKSEIEQIHEAEKQETLRKANLLRDEAHDSVKLLKTLGARAAAFTIRDQQRKITEELEKDHLIYDEKMNTLMELERLEGLKKEEEIAEAKRLKRYQDREILEKQIEERRLQRDFVQQEKKKEAKEILMKISQQQEEIVEKEKQKNQNTQKIMEEIKHFNEIALQKKKKKIEEIKKEEEQILQYQKQKMIEMQQREEEEEKKKQDAELRCAQLRSLQEKVANEQAEMDALRAKRAAEARERQARDAEIALTKRQQEQFEQLRQAREEQAMHQQRARIKEAESQQKEFESIMKQVNFEKKKIKEEEEKKKKKNETHRQILQQQIEEKNQCKKNIFQKKQQEGNKLKEEYAKELEKLEKIRLEEVQRLLNSGINPIYLAEMKALDLDQIRNR